MPRIKKLTKEKAPRDATLRVRSLTQEKSAHNLTRSATLRSDKIDRLSDFSFPRSLASRGPRFGSVPSCYDWILKTPGSPPDYPLGPSN